MTTTVEPAELTRTVIEAWNCADWSAYRAVVGPAFVHEQCSTGQCTDDVDEVVRSWQRVKAVFPDSAAEIVALGRLGPRTVAGVIWRAVQSAPTLDGTRIEPPTYKTITTRDVITMCWRDGRLESEQHQLGFLALMAPLLVEGPDPL
jgi:hypothetical protein